MTRRLLICEGPDDKAFLRALMDARGIQGIRIETTQKPGEPAAGLTHLGGKLRTELKAVGSAKTKPDRILIVVDSDDDPVAQFNHVAGKIEDVMPGKAPANVRVGSGTDPEFTVVTVPFDAEGCLECFLQTAARSLDGQLTAKVDNFAAAVRVDEWGRENSRGKFWLRSFLAARHERDPFIFLGRSFRLANGNSILPLNHNSFDDLATILNQFSVS